MREVSSIDHSIAVEPFIPVKGSRRFRENVRDGSFPLMLLSMALVDFIFISTLFIQPIRPTPGIIALSMFIILLIGLQVLFVRHSYTTVLDRVSVKKWIEQLEGPNGVAWQAISDLESTELPLTSVNITPNDTIKIGTRFAGEDVVLELPSKSVSVSYSPEMTVRLTGCCTDLPSRYCDNKTADRLVRDARHGDGIKRVVVSAYGAEVRVPRLNLTIPPG